MSQLKTFSASLHSLIRGRLSESELSDFELIFAEAMKEGGADEAPIIRETGVSFNPRTARICQIVADDGNDFSLFSLCVSALSCTSPKYAILAVPGHTPDRKEAALVRAAMFSHLPLKVKLSDLSAVGMRVFFAHRLDQLRHLHMTSLPQTERLALCELISKEIPFATAVENGRILQKINHTLSRVTQLCSLSSVG